MSGWALLRRAALIAPVGIVRPTGAQESASIANFTFPNFGWLLNSGVDWLPVEGMVAPVGGPDPNWRGGIGLPANDFNYQPPVAGFETSRFPYMERACMPGSPTTPGRPSACVGALGHIAFRYTDRVGTRNQFSIAAQWLACTFPCRRFADVLADACARLGDDVVRYSFIVVDLHHLLLASLPAHLCENVLDRRPDCRPARAVPFRRPLSSTVSFGSAWRPSTP